MAILRSSLGTSVCIWLLVIKFRAINNYVRQRRTTTEAGEFRIQDARGFLDREEFLARLNGRLGSVRGGRDAQLWFALSRMEDSETSAQLKLYVDEWLDTGVGKDGVEDPRNRDLTKAPNAHRAIKRFSRKRTAELTVTSDGLFVRFLSRPPVTTGDLMQRVGLPKQTAEDADRLFALFCLSDWHGKLAKCRRADCCRYFELRRWNRVYKRGTLCPECTRARSLESAGRHTSHVRKVAESELYRLVAKQFSKRITKDPKWHESQSLKAVIIQYLSRNIEDNGSLGAVYRSGGRQGISLKWLGWAKHQGGIESAVKELTHA